MKWTSTTEDRLPMCVRCECEIDTAIEPHMQFSFRYLGIAEHNIDEVRDSMLCAGCGREFRMWILRENMRHATELRMKKRRKRRGRSYIKREKK